jgi:hypothetical protein
MWTSKWTPEIFACPSQSTSASTRALPAALAVTVALLSSSLMPSLALSIAVAIVDTHPTPSASRARSLVRRRPCCYRTLPLSYTQFRYPARSSSDPGTAIEHWRTLHRPSSLFALPRPASTCHCMLSPTTTSRLAHVPCLLPSPFRSLAHRPRRCPAAPLPALLRCARHPPVNSRPAPHALLL